MATPPLKLKRGTTSVASPKAVATAVAGEPIIRYNTDQGKYANLTEFYLGDSGGTTSKLIADSGATSAANAMLTEAGTSTAAVLTLSEDTTTGTDFVAIDVPAAGTITSYTITLPPAAGATGTVLRAADANGNLEWATTGTTNDSTITLSAGAGLTDGGSFTTNQGTADTLTFNVGAGTGISVTADAVAIDTAVTADLTTAQTLENKTVVADNFLIEDGTDTTIKAAFDISANTTATTRTYTLPDASGTVALQGALGTITLGTDTSGNYVEAVTTAADSGIVGGNAAGVGTTSALALKNAANLTDTALLLWDDGNGQLANSSITETGGTVTIAANLTVTGTTTTVSTTNTSVADRIIELANGTTGTPAATADAGLIVERGDSANVFVGFDEGDDVFVAGTTAATGATGGDAAPTPIAFLALEYKVTDTAGTNEAVISYLLAGAAPDGATAGRYLQNVTIDCGTY